MVEREKHRVADGRRTDNLLLKNMAYYELVSFMENESRKLLIFFPPDQGFWFFQRVWWNYPNTQI